MTQIRDWLNEQGVKNIRGQKLTYNSVQHLLNNRRHIGEYTYRDIVVPDGIPAIVPQDLFDRVQEKIVCEKLAKPKVSAEFMTFWLHRFRKLDVRQKSHRKMLTDTFINAIFLYDDKMVITFHYKDGTDTITFDDLKAALADKKTGSDLLLSAVYEYEI